MREGQDLNVYRRGPPPSSAGDRETLIDLSYWNRSPNDPLCKEADLASYFAKRLADRRQYPSDQAYTDVMMIPGSILGELPREWPRLSFRHYTTDAGDGKVEIGWRIFTIDGEEDEFIIIGLIYDSDWLRQTVSRIIAQDRIIIRPTSILDGDDNVVATTDTSGMSEFEESISFPISEQAFISWRIYFPDKPHDEFLKTYETTRSVNIPLIISAIVIMVLAVLGAVRNLASELSLAELRSAFVAKVSHELRTPLGLIRLFAETLEMGRYKDEAQGKDYLHTITKESERLSRLIDNVLDFSQIEAGQKAYQLRLDSISDVVKSVVELLQFHADRHGLTLEVQVEAGLPSILFDRAAVEQAIWNLITNAIKYSGQGKTIEVFARRGEGEVIVEVRDHGIGIQPTEREKIFKQFFRVDDPRVQEKRRQRSWFDRCETYR